MGKVFTEGEWKETKRFMIMYGKVGAHIVPVIEK